MNEYAVLNVCFTSLQRMSPHPFPHPTLAFSSPLQALGSPALKVLSVWSAEVTAALGGEEGWTIWVHLLSVDIMID